MKTRIETAKGVEDSERWVHDVAAAMGVRAIFGATNLRSHILSHWEKYDHGSALASIGLCLAPLIGHMCIPSAFSYQHLIPHGSSPLVDEMFGTDRMFVFHDGAEVTRAEKVEALVKWNKELALQYLRVCLINSGGAYNCGRCRKCVRTAIPLKALGVLSETNIFRDKDEAQWEAVMEKDHLELLRENYEFVKRRGTEPQLEQMLERFMRKQRFQAAVAELEQLTVGGVPPKAAH
jgi:hypothetical protein